MEIHCDATKKQCGIHKQTNQGLTQNTFEEETNGRMWGGN